jgi:RNA polymerase sigma-70 factor (ECF subfamily)
MNETLLVSSAALFGDRKAFNRLVEFYQSPLRRFFFNLTSGDEELSKDLAQETFLKAWLNISSFRAVATFSTWLYRIAFNTFYDHVRARKQTAGTGVNIAADCPDNEVVNKDFNIDFAQALTILKEDERTAMLLFYMEDYTVNKISKIMNCPSGTVKSHISRGKKKLATYFKNTEYNKNYVER